MSKLLLVGPCLNKKDSTQTGGIVILFEDLLYWLKTNSIPFYVIDLNKNNYTNKYVAFISIVFQLLWKIPKAQVVSLHGTAKDYLLLAPFAVFFSKLFRKKISLRKFAGNFDKIYNDSSLFKKKMYRYVLSEADVLFFETKYLVQFAVQFNKNSFWLPNTRRKSMFCDIKKIEQKIFSKRFVFMSHVKKAKGVLELLNVFSQLDKSYTLDIYGIIDDIDVESLYTTNVNYINALNSNQVLEVLSQYDVLLLPSLRPAEGYPGIIIEALSLGLPVISTNVGGIPEIYSDGVEGYIIEPKNSEQLLESIKKINDSNYKMMSKNALERFKYFDSDMVYNEIKNKMFLL